MKVRNSSIIMTFVLVFVVVIGIGLFFLREKMMPGPIGHEITIQEITSTQRIVSDEFLILVRKNHLDKLYEILTP